jgi:hypothetical protein
MIARSTCSIERFRRSLRRCRGSVQVPAALSEAAAASCGRSGRRLHTEVAPLRPKLLCTATAGQTMARELPMRRWAGGHLGMMCHAARSIQGTVPVCLSPVVQQASVELATASRHEGFTHRRTEARRNLSPRLDGLLIASTEPRAPAPPPSARLFHDAKARHSARFFSTFLLTGFLTIDFDGRDSRRSAPCD